MDIRDYTDWLCDLTLERAKLKTVAESYYDLKRYEESGYAWDKGQLVDRRIRYVNERIRELEGEVE